MECPHTVYTWINGVSTYSVHMDKWSVDIQCIPGENECLTMHECPQTVHTWINGLSTYSVHMYKWSFHIQCTPGENECPILQPLGQHMDSGKCTVASINALLILNTLDMINHLSLLISGTECWMKYQNQDWKIFQCQCSLIDKSIMVNKLLCKALQRLC